MGRWSVLAVVAILLFSSVTPLSPALPVAVAMSLLGVWFGYGAFLLAKKVLPKNKVSITAAAAFAGLISVPAAAIGFVIQYAFGATATFSLTTVLTAMVGTHILIGIGEAIITGLSVSAVMASRPDLVFGYRGAKKSLEIRES